MDLRGIGTVIITTKLDINSVVGVAIFVASLGSFTAVGRICGRFFSRRRTACPAQDYIRITHLPGSIGLRVRTVTMHDTWNLIDKAITESFHSALLGNGPEI